MGIKQFVVCDSQTGYTCSFDVYLGSAGNPAEGGEAAPGTLTYGIVMKLMDNLLDQGYRVYLGNWYTAVPLMKTLTERGTLRHGTIHLCRSRFRRLDKEAAEQHPDTYIPWIKTVTRGN